MANWNVVITPTDNGDAGASVTDESGEMRYDGPLLNLPWVYAITLQKLDIAQRIADSNLRIALARIYGVACGSGDGPDDWEEIRKICEQTLGLESTEGK